MYTDSHAPPRRRFLVWFLVYHRYALYTVNGDIILDVADLPKAIKNTFKELEGYDQNKDPMFFEGADMLYMMADRFLKDGAIDRSTHEKLIMKYPIA